MGETILYFIFCLLICGVIGISLFVDDLNNFWLRDASKKRSKKSPKKKYSPQKRKTLRDYYIPKDIDSLKALANQPTTSSAPNNPKSDNPKKDDISQIG